MITPFTAPLAKLAFEGRLLPHTSKFSEMSQTYTQALARTVHTPPLVSSYISSESACDNVDMQIIPFSWTSRI